MSILLVMNDDVDAHVTWYLLSQLDHLVVAASTVAEARQRLDERLWSVVILDTNLPDGSGFDLLRALAEHHSASGILVLSAPQDVVHRVRALEEGADDYVTRPYQPAELIARVRSLLRRFRQRRSSPGRPDASIVRAGGLELAVNELVVKLPGSRCERLTPNEMRLLHYLMTHAQRIVEHRELVARLFGDEDATTSPSAVGVNMRRVRRKIEVNPDHPRYIVTVRGAGYRFQTDAQWDDGDPWPPRDPRHEGAS